MNVVPDQNKGEKSPQSVEASRALDRIGEALREQGLTLDELIESGRAIRGDLLREMYGIEPDDVL